MTTAPIQPPFAGAPPQAGALGLAVGGAGQAYGGSANARPLSAEAALSGGLDQTLRLAAVTQGGLAPLLADLRGLAGSAALPLAVADALAGLLRLQTPLGPEVRGDDIRQALARSGLLLEARLAADPSRQPAAAGPQDLKSALLQLRQTLGDWVEALAAAPDPLAAPGEDPSPEPHPAAAASPGSLTAPPPPPMAGARPSAQAPAASSLAPEMAARLIAKRLLGEVRAAVSRQTLLQIASLPANGGADASVEGTEARWLFEAPFPTPRGSAVAQFEISRDAPRRQNGTVAAIWRARFSLDLEPAGRVHVEVSLSADKTRTTLWAEREDIAAQFSAQAAELIAALRAEGPDADVACRIGAPPARAVAAGRFLDRAT